VGLFDSLFGKKPAESPGSGDQPAHSKSGAEGAKPIALIVVFEKAGSYTADALLKTLQGMSPITALATVQSLPGTVENGTPVLRVAWAEHVIDVVGMDVPAPKGVIEKCVQPAHYPQEAKAKIRASRSHAILFNSGSTASVQEKYVALGIVAAAFAKHGGIGVLNEAAMTSLTGELIYTMATARPDFEMLRHLPLLMLYCGFVKYFLPDKKTAWMRTYNNPTFGLPDFASKAALDQAKATFDLFSGLMTYLLKTGKKFVPGHTAEMGDLRLKFRAPRDDEPFPTDSAGQLLIVEVVS
jgi:hypothetical protein